MKWITIQLIKLNSNLPKNELDNRNNYFGLKGIGKFTYNLFINIFFKQKKKTTMATLFSTLDPYSKTDLLSKSVAFAKREIADNGNPLNRTIEQIASDYIWQDGVVISDYSIIQPQIVTIVAWTGTLPIKFPRP
jgi:hypothetical protein